MSAIFAARARLPDGWADHVRITLDAGRIADIAPNAERQDGDTRVDALLPALSNLHSHSFQRAMAGMTEHRASGQDTFWTWRDLMYRFTAALTPDMIEAIAALAFMEMLEAGYAAVGEFHYLHHQPDGTPYDDLGELAHRISAAAASTGIGLTHLPVLYTYGGAGEASLQPGQARFGNSVNRYAALVEQTRRGIALLPDDCTLGIAPHSLRATSPDDLDAALAAHKGAQVHIHIAEQTAEVDAITQWLGTRPVDWLLNNQDVDATWCLIHATHTTDAEIQAMARSGATAGLCPVTEANLGDGTFNGVAYLQSGGAFGVGTDSNIAISMGQELRALEYSQRLRDQARNVLTTQDGSVGAALYAGAAQGGARALGRDAGRIAKGALADLVAIDTGDLTLCNLTSDQLEDGLIFAARDRVITDTWAAGRHMVQGGRHVSHDQIAADYRATLQDLLPRL